MIIAILNQKGGCGKTMLAINIAKVLSLTSKVLLVDSDKQATARKWHVRNEGEVLNVIGLDRPTLAKDINKLKYDYTDIVIDGAGALDDILIAAVKCADIVLVPVQPGEFDVWGTDDLVDVLSTNQSLNNGLPRVAFVMSRDLKNTHISRDTEESLRKYNYPILTARATQRVLYSTLTGSGQTVLSYPKTKAAEEILQITNELRSLYAQSTINE